MVIHSGGLMLLTTYLLALAAVMALLVSAVLALGQRLYPALKVVGGTLLAVAIFVFVATVAMRMAPQRIIEVGDSYCWDSWCMGVQRVRASVQRNEKTYRVDVRIFSDAGNIQQLGDAVVFLEDERGRRFRLVEDPAFASPSVALSPHQSIDTTLTFVTPEDVKKLFLTGDAPLPDPVPLSWKVACLFADLHIGYEKLLHKPTLLRVL